ncbi:MAG: DNA polymerase III subunit delta [Candidatus Ornithospirochaeta sp.]|nr:DNA polymerase III subunit delta [Candidatus Ornithospirochaeta sp.]
MAGIHILLGPEEGEKEEWLRKEKEAVLSTHPDAEIHVFFAGDDSGEQVLSVLSQSSLFSSFRLVIVKHFENAKKNDDLTRALSEYAASPMPDAELIVISSASASSSVPKALLDAAGKDGTRIFWEMFENRKRDWIRQEARKRGFRITDGAIDELLESVENNTAELRSALDSITLFLKLKGNANAISEDDIEGFLSRTKGESGYTLFKAVASRDLERAGMIISSIYLASPYDATGAFTVLSNQFRLLESCLEMKAERKSEDAIFKEAEYVSTSFFPAFKGIRQKEKDTFRAAMRNYTLEETRSIIAYLGKMDSVLKSSPADITRSVFDLILYTVIISKGKESGIRLDPEELSYPFC